MYVTYGDLLTFVIMLCAVITLVYKHKKQRPLLGQVGAIFSVAINRGGQASSSHRFSC